MEAIRRAQASAHGRRLFVSGVATDVKKTDLQREFGEYGHVVDIELPLTARGVAFVEFDNARDAADALEEVTGKKLKGMVLKVKIADEKLTLNAQRERDANMGAPPRRAAAATNAAAAGAAAAAPAHADIGGAEAGVVGMASPVLRAMARGVEMAGAQSKVLQNTGPRTRPTRPAIRRQTSSAYDVETTKGLGRAPDVVLTIQAVPLNDGRVRLACTSMGGREVHKSYATRLMIMSDVRVDLRHVFRRSLRGARLRLITVDGRELLESDDATPALEAIMPSHALKGRSWSTSHSNATPSLGCTQVDSRGTIPNRFGHGERKGQTLLEEESATRLCL
eukprot:CAMPEP_0117531894 /NCGR_PEP_ID=MMETSP0784-20121206/39091_1 /TAXON_ID=39447 /ORGANISM="" /LENGTH=335 /DNA_ID=CAMNT_0005328277 /DNA_START=36 /DNA_END=1044 /DNA_ORIENTATION=-